MDAIEKRQGVKPSRRRAIHLREYQRRAVAALGDHRRPLLVMPTGAGKTTVAAALIRRELRAGSRVLFVVHRRELVDQAVGRLADFGIRAGVVAGGRPGTSRPRVQVAMIQALQRRCHPPADVVLIDEAHHVAAKSYSGVLQRYAGARVVGLTATPFRADGRGLGEAFDAIVDPVTVAELVRADVIVDPTVFAPAETPDLSGVRTVAGDFNRRDLSGRMNRQELVGSILDHWRDLAEGRRTVVFAVSIEHSRSIVDRFRAAGVAAEHVEAKSPDRAAIFARLRSGETTVVSNVGIVTEGWDLPSLEVAILARPTKSLALHRQMIGRVMRAAEGKRALVLDHAGNHLRLGLVTDPIAYSLSGPVERGTVPRIRRCACGCITRGATCSACGASAPSNVVPFPLVPVERAGKLVLLRKPESEWRYEDLPPLERMMLSAIALHPEGIVRENLYAAIEFAGEDWQRQVAGNWLVENGLIERVPGNPFYPYRATARGVAISTRRAA